MPDNLSHLYFSRSLERFSTRLDELLTSIRRHHSQLTPESIDEIAYVTGELMVVLMDYHAAHQEDRFLKEALAHAQLLHRHLRARPIEEGQIAQTCDTFRHEIDLLIRQSKRAA
jgi:hypothetical protein